MRFSELLRESAISLTTPAGTREEVIEHLLDHLEELPDREAALAAVVERERALSTGVGQGVAVPHATLTTIREPLVSFGRTVEGVDFGAMDGRPVHLVFLLLAPEDQVALHLKILSRISRLVSDTSLRDGLLGAGDPAEVVQLFTTFEARYQEF